MRQIRGWLAVGMVLATAAGVFAQEPDPGLNPGPDQGQFAVVLLSLKHDWQAMRYHKQTGQSWYTLKGDWKPVPEAGELTPPSGDYKVLMSATGENDWIALRVEQKSGRSWRLAALKWIEMRVLGPDELPPEQPQGVAGPQ